MDCGGRALAVEPPAYDASLHEQFHGHITGGGGDASSWRTQHGVDDIQLPILSSAAAELLYFYPGGLYLNYEISKAYYFPTSEYLLVFTHQPRRAVRNDSMHGFLLLKEDVLARIPAAGELRDEHGPEAVRALKLALSEPDHGLRRPAIASLEDIGEPVVPALVQGLHHHNGRVRARAVEALMSLGEAGSSAVPVLGEALNDPQREVRLNATRALAEMGERAEAAVPYLIDALKDTDAEVRQHAAGALGVIGKRPEDVVPALLVALGDEERGVRKAARDALGAIGQPVKVALPAFLEASLEEEPKVRTRIVAGLGRLGELATELTPAFIEMMDEADADVRRETASVLGRMADARAIPVVLEALDDESAKVRRAAASILRGLEDPRIVPALIRAMDDSDSTVRWYATGSLNHFADTRSVPVLIRALTDPRREVRSVAASALFAMGPDDYREGVEGDGELEAVLPRLRYALHIRMTEDSWSDRERRVRAVAGILSALGDRGPGVVPELLAAVEHADAHVRGVAAFMLSEVEPAQTEIAIDVLANVVADAGDAGARMYAARKLQEFGRRASRAVPALINALREDDEALQSYARAALKAIDTDEARNALEDYEESRSE